MRVRSMRLQRAFGMFVSATAVAVACASFAAPARAEYFVLRSGTRLHVDGYQRLDGKYRLQIGGGFVEAQADEVVAIEPEDVFTSNAPAPAAAKGPFRDLIEAAASRYHVDAELIASVIAAESNFNPKAVSRRNARGLMQLLPTTAARLGVHNVFDPSENIGPMRVQQYGRVPPYAETQGYVRKVRTAYAKRKAAVPAGAKAAATTPSDTVVAATTTPAGS
jgi:soluble lytic murein transglycosylase-like protein